MNVGNVKIDWRAVASLSCAVVAIVAIDGAALVVTSAIVAIGAVGFSAFAGR